MSRVVATVGAIPGAGATTVVTALGSALAEQRSHVALVDASAEGSRIADVLSLEGDGVVADALRRRADLADVQASGPHGLRAFPAAPDTNWAAVRPGAVESAYEQLRDRFDVVLVDCGSELTPASAAWIGHADELVIVSCPDVADAAADTAALGAAFDVPILGIVANRVVPDERSETLDALDDSPHQTLGVLPEDATVDAAASERRSVLVHEPDSQIASCAWEFARRVRESDHTEPVVPDTWSGLDVTADSTDSGTNSDGGTESASTSETTPSAATDSTTGADDSHDGSAAEQPTSDASVDRTAADATDSGPTDAEPTDSGPADAEPTDSGPADAEPTDSGPADAEPTDSEPSSTEATGSDDGSDSGFEWSSSDDLDGDGADSDGARTVGSDDGSSDTDDLDDESDERSSSLSSDISVDLGSDGSGSSSKDADSTSAGSSSVADGRDASGATGATGDDSALRTNGGRTPADDRATGTDSTEGESDADSEISDEEIEEVFKETMQQVKEDRDATEEQTDSEAGEDGDDSVLGGFMGS